MKKFIILIFALFGLIMPSFAELQTASELPSQAGIVRSIEYVDTPSLQQGSGTEKQVVEVEITRGIFKGEKLFIDNMITGNPAYDIYLKKGDRVILHAETKSQTINSVKDIEYFIADIQRDCTLVWTTIIFCGLLVIIGRKKGVFSLISILATIAIIFLMLIPSILNGISIILATVIACMLSTIITIYLVGGLNSKSTSAIIGTVISLTLAGVGALLVIHFAKLTGFSGEESMFLYSAHPELNFTGILASSIIIAALGALMDTAVSIASTINEIHNTDLSLTRIKLFQSGMNVGRDIIGTMSNTLILVYLGSSLPLVLLSSNIDMQKFFNLNQVATEIASALVGSIAILVCVPVTAIVTTFMIKKKTSNL